MTINKYIFDEIIKRGFKAYEGNNKKIINNFEKKPISNDIFNYFKKYPFMRVIYQLIYDEIPLSVDEVFNNLNETNLKKSLPNSPLVNLLCPNCQSMIDFYNPYTQRKPKRKRKCSFCHVEIQLNECEENEDWNLTHNQVDSFLNGLTEHYLLKEKYYGYCMDHGAVDLNLKNIDEVKKLNKSELIEYTSSYYCKKCYKHYDIDRAYIENEILSDLFGNSGLWLEWYVKNLLLLNTKLSVDNGIIIVDKDEVSYEVDVIALNKNKLCCIECKAIHPTKKIGSSELPYVNRWKPFADKVIITTTGKIKERDKTLLYRDSIEILETLDIEKIRNYIK